MTTSSPDAPRLAWCPWCAETGEHTHVRAEGDALEWRCSGCDGLHTTKVGDDEHAYLLFPPDIEAALNNDIETLALDFSPATT